MKKKEKKKTLKGNDVVPLPLKSKPHPMKLAQFERERMSLTERLSLIERPSQ